MSSSVSRDEEGSSHTPSKPFSVSLSKGSGPSSNKAFNLPSSNRSRAIDSPGSSSRSLARRPHHLGHGDDSDDEGDNAPVHEEVSGFDTHTGGALTADGQTVNGGNKQLVIPVASKNNWRDRPGVNVKKGKKNLLPREVQAMQEAERNGQVTGGAEKEIDAPSMTYGLSFARKPTTQENIGVAGEGEDRTMPDATPLLPPPVEEQKPLTDDQIALQALLRQSQGDVERRTDLIIESSEPGRVQHEDEEPERYDETSSFRTDVASRPESATLDAYNAIPVEEFGAALLRGMGWKDGQPIGRGQYGTSATADRDRANKPRIPERRPGFLGIGAKDASGGKGAEAEFGAWGKSAMRKASRKQENGNTDGNKAEGVYMPVMMRNKKTGEQITEEELAALQKEAKSKVTKPDDWRERRDRNLEKSGRDRDRDKGYRRRDYDDGDRSDRRNGSSRRDRSRSGGRHSSRRSRYDDEESSRSDQSRRDRDRRRERDGDQDRRRDRDREYEKERDRDDSHRYRDERHSSSRHSSHSSRQDRESHRSRRDD